MPNTTHIESENKNWGWFDKKFDSSGNGTIYTQLTWRLRCAMLRIWFIQRARNACKRSNKKKRGTMSLQIISSVALLHIFHSQFVRHFPDFQLQSLCAFETLKVLKIWYLVPWVFLSYELSISCVLGRAKIFGDFRRNDFWNIWANSWVT